MKYYTPLVAFCCLFMTGCGAPPGPPTDSPDGNEALDVPFTSQAPEGNWAEPWQNACEETSIVMVDAFFDGDELSKRDASQRIKEIFAEKKKVAGDSFDESMSTIASVIHEAELGWEVILVENPTVEDMTSYLEAGNPIIAPVYARELDNPYYPGEGPDYHVVVVTGYDDVTGEFIVHDPGTSRGESLRFVYQEFYDAIHDYLGTDNYTDGPKRMLVAIVNE